MKILLVQTGFLGDVVLSTPLLPNLAETYPGAELSVLTTPGAAAIFRDNPLVKEVLVFDKRGADSGFGGLLRMAGKLRQRKFDLVFSLHKSYRTAALLTLAGIPVRYGFKEASASWLYTKTVGRSDLSHDVLRNLAVLRNIDIEPENAKQEMSVVLSSENLARARELLKGAEGQPMIGVAPGSVWATKRWTVEGFSQTAKELQDDGYRVVLIGGKDDAAIAEEIAAAVGEKVINLVGKTSLIESAAVLSHLELLLTNDSAPLHLASAVGLPVVVLFCATVPEFGFGPWNVPSRVLGVDNLACRPCGRHGGNTCPTGTHACQLSLRSEYVTANARSLLAEVGAGRSRPATGSEFTQ